MRDEIHVRDVNALSERAQELSRVFAFRVVFSVLEIGARYHNQSAQSCIDGTVTTEPPVALELRAHWHCRLLREVTLRDRSPPALNIMTHVEGCRTRPLYNRLCHRFKTTGGSRDDARTHGCVNVSVLL